jgi:GTP-binding protein
MYSADRGRHGEGSNRTGRSGKDLRIQVPVGTQVFDIETDRMLGEILTADDELVVAAGSMGGRGNARFATPTQRAPRHSEPGRAGEELRIRLELKLLADVGIVGLPNAGKSTFVSTVSAARPKVADYPFTTLIPHLGVVAESRDVEPFVIADLPGLIEGAATGSGLGHRFLKHVERCRTLLHLVDLSDPSNDAEADVATIERELIAFDPQLLDRKRLIVGTKLDAADDERRLQLKRAAQDRGLRYREISSATRVGLDGLLHEVRQSLVEGTFS